MTEFLAALALFLISHAIPARPALRKRLVARYGERTYRLLYSGLSLLLLAWLISAAARAPYVPLWDVTIGQYWVPVVAMLPAFILFAGGALVPNPLSVSFRRGGFDPRRAGVITITRHPILWGFALWAFAHAVPNGDLFSLIMFAGFGLFALAGMALIDRRKQRELGSRWKDLARRTSVIPLTPPPGDRLPWDVRGLAIALAAGMLLYIALLHLHPGLFGPDPRAVFR